MSAKRVDDSDDRVRLTTRVSTDIDEALRRCATDRKIKRAKPYTIETIVEAALKAWLKKEGHWPPKG